jgi:hypothetical protein
MTFEEFFDNLPRSATLFWIDSDIISQAELKHFSHYFCGERDRATVSGGCILKENLFLECNNLFMVSLSNRCCVFGVRFNPNYALEANYWTVT